MVAVDDHHWDVDGIARVGLAHLVSELAFLAGPDAAINWERAVFSVTRPNNVSQSIHHVT